MEVNSPHALNLSSETWQQQLQQTLISHPKCYWPVGLKSLSLVSGRRGSPCHTQQALHTPCNEQIWLQLAQADLEELRVSQQGVAATPPRKHTLHRTGLNTKLWTFQCCRCTAGLSTPIQAEATPLGCSFEVARACPWASARWQPQVRDEPTLLAAERIGCSGSLLCPQQKAQLHSDILHRSRITYWGQEPAFPTGTTGRV